MNDRLTQREVHEMFSEMLIEVLYEFDETGEVNERKLKLLATLMFEKLFHRTHDFISDEIDEFRGLRRDVHTHSVFMEWAKPIVADMENFMIKARTVIGAVLLIGSIAGVMFGMITIANKYFGYNIQFKIENIIEKPKDK